MAIVLDGTTNTVTPLNGALGGTTPSTVVATTVVASSTIKGATTIAVGNATPSASGAGITFPATQSASTDANTLDDYEEGTWTPSLGGNTTYTAQDATYTKVGRLVTVTCDLQINVKGTGSSTDLSGLPYAATGGVYANGSVSYFNALAVNTISLVPRVVAGGTGMVFFGLGTSSNTTAGNLSIFGNGTRIFMTVSYFTS